MPKLKPACFLLTSAFVVGEIILSSSAYAEDHAPGKKPARSGAPAWVVAAWESGEAPAAGTRLFRRHRGAVENAAQVG